jgi:hypothetical protein
MWKKKIAVLMAAAMITGMSGMTVFAEEGAPQMTQQAPAGMEGQAPQGKDPAGQPPQMGQQAPQGEAPQNGQQPPMIGQQPPQAPQGEAPANNGQQSSQGAAPQMEQRRQRRGKMDHGQARQGDKDCVSQNQAPQGDKGRASQNQEHGRPFIDFEACVKDGTISQETYDAIKKYMDENKPERPTAGGEEDSKPEMKDGEKPELPEEGEKPEKPDLLKNLLDAEVITQDEYDALVKRSDEEKAADTKDKAMAAQEDKEADETA